jgi:hypothetical protein
MLNLCFLHPVESVGQKGYSGASRKRNVDTLFFMFIWALCSFHKNHARTRYTELVFLYLVQSMGHVVRPGDDALIFMLRFDRFSSTKSAPGHVTLKLCFYI